MKNTKLTIIQIEQLIIVLTTGALVTIYNIHSYNEFSFLLAL